jgi:hypothetical protein
MAQPLWPPILLTLLAVMCAGAVSDTQDWQLLQDLRGYDEYLKHLQKAAGQDRAPNGCLDC